MYIYYSWHVLQIISKNTSFYDFLNVHLVHLHHFPSGKYIKVSEILLILLCFVVTISLNNL